MRAFLNLRYAASERGDAFRAGLSALGYSVEIGVTMKPAPGDLLISWNIMREAVQSAAKFAEIGAPVIVVENATWGNDFKDGPWLHMALGKHNTAGCFPVGGPERWDSLGVTLPPFRTEGETVVIGQRGIGPRGIAAPHNWRPAGRFRPHPGMRACVPLEKDLANAGKVITWGSGAAVKALMMGIPVESHMPNWLAEQDNTEAGRLAMFRRLAWAQWRMSEIRSGDAFRWMLPDFGVSSKCA